MIRSVPLLDVGAAPAQGAALRYVAFDPGANCGWAAWDGFQARAGEWRLDAFGTSLGARCDCFSRHVSALCQEVNPDTLAIEEPFYDRTHQLHGYFAFACTIAHRLRIELRTFWPLQIKKHAVGWGRRWVDGHRQTPSDELIAAAMRRRFPEVGEVGTDSCIALTMVAMLLDGR